MDFKTLCINCFADKDNKNSCPSCGYEEKTAEQPETSIFLPLRTILAEKYITGKVLGQGGFGITYLGWDAKLERKLAIKEFFPQGMVSRLPGQAKVVSYSGDESGNFEYGLNRFIKEAQTLARFEEHPNIVTIRDYFEANSTAYMIMNYIEGVTLEQHLRAKGGRITFDQALRILMPVLDALKEVHEEGFMHRDISPDNILINKKGRVILIDFGAARQEMREKSKSLSVILKAGYAPEEQYRSRGKQGPWTDIYAVSATFYRCITGQVPPEAMDRLAEDDLAAPSKLGFSIVEDQEEALLKALTVRAEGRFQTVEDFQAALLSSVTVEKAALPVKEKQKIIAPPIIKRPEASYDADYYIDYTGGTIPLSELPIGSRVVDPTWQWEFKTGDNYTGKGELKPVTWLVVAKNHYDIKEPHVTLLSEELIGRFLFDNSKGWLGLNPGKNHWGDSGTGNAKRGLRPWMNSSGIHSSEGFYQAFSENFKGALLVTTLPNKEWKNGNSYSTQDYVFIPSTTELGDSAHHETYRIGKAYPYFQGENDAKRVAYLNSKILGYWTRSPASYGGDGLVRRVITSGGFNDVGADDGNRAVRPALNLKSEILVSEIRN